MKSVFTLLALSTSRTDNQNINSKTPSTNDLDPHFSPNGSRVIFTNTDNTGTGPRNILTIDATGGNRTQALTQAEMVYWQ